MGGCLKGRPDHVIHDAHEEAAAGAGRHLFSLGELRLSQCRTGVSGSQQDGGTLSPSVIGVRG